MLDQGTAITGSLFVRRTAIAIFAAAVATRLAAVVLAFTISGVPPGRLPELRDGPGFRSYAAAVTRGRRGFEQLSLYDRRAFPGYPFLLLIVGAHRRPLIGIVLNWIAAAAAAVVAYRLYEDERVGWAAAVLTPSYVLYSTTLMSEAAVLLAGVGGLYLAKRNRTAAAGAALGFAAIARPLAAAFGFACLAIRSWRDRRFVRIAAIVMAIIVFTGAWLWWWSGSLTSGVVAIASTERGYADDRIFTWPFKSLLTVTFSGFVPMWKIAYIWAHVLIVFGGIALLMRERGPESHVSRVWLISNTVIVTCIGGIWGFHEFHRFIIPALPPLFFAYRRFLPRPLALWVIVACASAAVAAKALGHRW